MCKKNEQDWKLVRQHRPDDLYATTDDLYATIFKVWWWNRGALVIIFRMFTADWNGKNNPSIGGQWCRKIRCAEVTHEDQRKGPREHYPRSVWGVEYKYRTWRKCRWRLTHHSGSGGYPGVESLKNRCGRDRENEWKEWCSIRCSVGGDII